MQYQAASAGDHMSSKHYIRTETGDQPARRMWAFQSIYSLDNQPQAALSPLIGQKSIYRNDQESRDQPMREPISSPKAPVTASTANAQSESSSSHEEVVCQQARRLSLTIDESPIASAPSDDDEPVSARSPCPQQSIASDGSEILPSLVLEADLTGIEQDVSAGMQPLAPIETIIGFEQMPLLQFPPQAPSEQPGTGRTPGNRMSSQTGTGHLVDVPMWMRTGREYQDLRTEYEQRQQASDPRWPVWRKKTK